MGNKNMITSLVSRHTPVLILGIAFVLSSAVLVVVERFDVSRLSAFGALSQIYFTGIKNGLVVSTIVLFLSFFSFLFLKKQMTKTKKYLWQFYLSLSNIKKNILILVVCLVFIFTSHHGNILNGYFDADDFDVIHINQTTSLSQSLLITHADHTIPLFRVEMRAIYSAFGPNPIPYNIFVSIIFALIPFFTYLTIKRLGLRTLHWLIFLAIYSGSMAMAELITGYYIISVYLQIPLFFAVSMWSSIAWTQTKKWLYLIIFSASLLSALLIDTSGIWTIPAILSFIVMLVALSEQKNEKLLFARLFIEQKILLSIVAVISVLFVSFLAVTFILLYPNSSAISTGYPLSLLGMSKNIMSFVSSGMTLSILAPNIAKIIAHPAFATILGKFWVILGLIIFCANIGTLWFMLKKADKKEKAIAIFLTASFVLSAVMVLIVRPNESNIPDFDFKHVGMSFYFYCLLLTLGSSILIKHKKEPALRIIIPIIIVILALQQSFSFFAFRLKVEAQARKTAIENMGHELIGELNKLGGDKSSVLTIPNLDGQYIYQPAQGYSLADYLPFFNNKIPLQLTRNRAMNPYLKHDVLEVTSLRDTTSKSFTEALKTSSILKSYYASKIQMRYKAETIQISDKKYPASFGTGTTTTINKSSIDPEKRHIISIDFLTDDTPGNTELYFSFENDFGVNGTIGQIKIDDYSPYVLVSNKRSYNITVDMLQLYMYSMSKKVENIILQSSPKKNVHINKVYFE